MLLFLRDLEDEDSDDDDTEIHARLGQVRGGSDSLPDTHQDTGTRPRDTRTQDRQDLTPHLFDRLSASRPHTGYTGYNTLVSTPADSELMSRELMSRDDTESDTRNSMSVCKLKNFSSTLPLPGAGASSLSDDPETLTRQPALGGDIEHTGREHWAQPTGETSQDNERCRDRGCREETGVDMMNTSLQHKDISKEIDMVKDFSSGEHDVKSENRMQDEFMY